MDKKTLKIALGSAVFALLSVSTHNASSKFSSDREERISSCVAVSFAVAREKLRDKAAAKLKHAGSPTKG